MHVRPVLIVPVWICLMSSFSLGNGISIGSPRKELFSCSSFHYEEKVLEKLVRIEHNIELNKERMKDWEDKMKTKLKSLDEEFLEKTAEWEEQWKKQYSEKLKLFGEENSERGKQIEIDIKTKLTSIDREFANKSSEMQLLQGLQTSEINRFVINANENVTALAKEQKIAIKELKKKKDVIDDWQETINATFNVLMNNIKTDFKDREQRLQQALGKSIINTTTIQRKISDQSEKVLSYIEKEIRDLRTPPVLFHAFHVSQDSNLNKTDMKFKEVSYNFGNGYNPRTGNFTAPVTGVYIFSLQICSENGKKVKMQIIADEKPIAKLISHRNVASGPCVSTTGFASLEKGEKVFIRCVFADNGDSVYYGDLANFFSGVLIHK